MAQIFWPVTGMCVLSLVPYAMVSYPVSTTRIQGTHFTDVVWALNWNPVKNNFAFILIKAQICTCHDSLAVVTCAKLCLDLIIIFQVRTVCILFKIWMMSSWAICEMGHWNALIWMLLNKYHGFMLYRLNSMILWECHPGGHYWNYLLELQRLDSCIKQAALNLHESPPTSRVAPCVKSRSSVNNNNGWICGCEV